MSAKQEDSILTIFATLLPIWEIASLGSQMILRNTFNRKLFKVKMLVQNINSSSRIKPPNRKRMFHSTLGLTETKTLTSRREIQLHLPTKRFKKLRINPLTLEIGQDLPIQREEEQNKEIRTPRSEPEFVRNKGKRRSKSSRSEWKRLNSILMTWSLTHDLWLTLDIRIILTKLLLNPMVVEIWRTRLEVSFMVITKRPLI